MQETEAVGILALGPPGAGKSAIAKAAGINTHELLSRLNPRIRRVYRSEQAVSVHVRETTPLVVG